MAQPRTLRRMAERSRARLLLREMAPHDVPAVRRIEVASYADAWPATTFEEELRNAFATYLVVVDVSESAQPHAPSLLSRLLGRQDRGEHIVGYCGAWFHVDQLHIVTIAVAPDWQGRGIAQHMLIECFDRAAEAELRNVALEVRPSNSRARTIYERFGFEEQGVRRGYYVNNGEDAVIMLTKDLDSPGMRERLEVIRANLASHFGDVEWVEEVQPVASEDAARSENATARGGRG